MNLRKKQEQLYQLKQFNAPRGHNVHGSNNMKQKLIELKGEKRQIYNYSWRLQYPTWKLIENLTITVPNSYVYVKHSDSDRRIHN